MSDDPARKPTEPTEPTDGADPVTRPPTAPDTGAVPAVEHADGTHGMGVSSDRPGDLGGGRAGTAGTKDTSDEAGARAATSDAPGGRVEDGEVVPEQSSGLPEVTPDGVEKHSHNVKHNPGHTHG